MKTLGLFSKDETGVLGGQCEIWAIGGGKGGTGKSFITSSLGFSLAESGKRVVMLDADLGGPNLHTFLGVNRPRLSLTEFFDDKVPLQELVMDSGHHNIGLVSGDINSLDSNNIKYTQKQKLFRHIRQMDTDYLLIDLGGGTNNNITDFFLLADRMLVVIVPEITAVENMYHFIKNVFFRKLKMSLNSVTSRETVQAAWSNRARYGFNDLKGLLAFLRKEHPLIGKVLDRELSGFIVNLVLNRVRNAEEVKIGASVRSVLFKCFGFETRYAGYVEHDDSVQMCTNRRRPFLLSYPSSHCAREIKGLSENIMDGKQLRGII